MWPSPSFFYPIWLFHNKNLLWFPRRQNGRQRFACRSLLRCSLNPLESRMCRGEAEVQCGYEEVSGDPAGALASPLEWSCMGKRWNFYTPISTNHQAGRMALTKATVWGWEQCPQKDSLWASAARATSASDLKRKSGWYKTASTTPAQFMIFLYKPMWVLTQYHLDFPLKWA